MERISKVNLDLDLPYVFWSERNEATSTTKHKRRAEKYAVSSMNLEHLKMLMIPICLDIALELGVPWGELLSGAPCTSMAEEGVIFRFLRAKQLWGLWKHSMRSKRNTFESK